MSEENKARVREFIDRVLTAGEIEATGDYFHDDVVEEVLTRIRHAFPDSKWTVEEQIAEGNTTSSPALPGRARIRRVLRYSRDEPCGPGLGNGHRSVRGREGEVDTHSLGYLGHDGATWRCSRGGFQLKRRELAPC